MADKLMRTFLSIPVPFEVGSKKNMLYSTIEDSKGNINWVKNANLHLTLKFLGNTPESSFQMVIDSVEKITKDIKPFNLKIEKTGCFPVETRPRVLWMGVKGRTDPLLELVKDIEYNLHDLGFHKESQVFFPHVTLARIKYPQKVTPNIELFLKSTYDAIDFPIDRVQYFGSELLKTGAVYNLLKTFPLGEKL